jgi:hypothetical protein
MFKRIISNDILCNLSTNLKKKLDSPMSICDVLHCIFAPYLTQHVLKP